MKTIITIILLFSISTFAEEKKNVVYKYKNYESFDLGNLEIKGNLIAPGDLSVKERERKSFRRNLYERYEFNRETKKDVTNLR
jgi:hypothetical protein